MEPSKNSRYQVSLNTSPYSLGQNYNSFVEDLANTIPFNLILNGQFITINDDNSLFGWISSVGVSAGEYNKLAQRTVLFPANGSISQEIYSNVGVFTEQLLPNGKFSIILYTNSISGFKVEIIASGDPNRIFNINDYTQNQILTETISPTVSGEIYSKTLLQFSTASSGVLVGPSIILKITNTNSIPSIINLGYVALYQGLIEYAFLPDKYLIHLTLERGTAANPSIDFYNDLNTGIYSPGQYQVGVTTNGLLRTTVTSAGNYLINTPIDNGIDKFQVSGSAYISDNIKTDNSITATAGYFSGPVTGTNGTFSSTLNATAGYFSGPISATTGYFSGSINSDYVTAINTVYSQNGYFTDTVTGVSGYFNNIISPTISGTSGNFTNSLTLSGSPVLNVANYNDYAPSLNGQSATGNWNININGSAYYLYTTDKHNFKFSDTSLINISSVTVDNIALGYNSLSADTTGNSNIGIGTFSLNKNIYGNYNIGIGTNTLSLTENSTDNIAIGYNSGNLIPNGTTNSISIGSNTSTLESNQIVIGNNLITDTFLKGKINIQAGSNNGIVWPNDAFSGASDTASIYLDNPEGGEKQQLIIKLTDNIDDKIILMSSGGVVSQNSITASAGFIGNLNGNATTSNNSTYAISATNTLTLNNKNSSNTSYNSIPISNAQINTYLYAASADNAFNSINAINATNAGNADTVDNLHANDFYLKTDTVTNATNAGNADTVDNKHANDFYLKTDTVTNATNATNADTVDNKHANDFYLKTDTVTNATNAANASKIDGLTLSQLDSRVAYTFSSNYVMTYTLAFTNIVNRLDFNSNYFYVYPPTGKTMANLVSFIASISSISFAGSVNGDDKLYIDWFWEVDKIKVMVQNTEQRSNAAAHYMAIWK
jgi:hypothetical protein